MENHIEEVNLNELILSMYHPKIFHLYKKYKNIMDAYIIKKSDDEIAKKLYKHLEDITEGLSAEGFKFKCESLGFSESLTKFLTDKFQKYIEMEGDDYLSYYERTKNFILFEALSNEVDRFNIDHEAGDFIDRVSEYKVADLSNNFGDEKSFTEYDFGDVNVDEIQDDAVQGVIKSSLNIINDANSVGGYIKGQMVVFAAPCKAGKSMLAMQEAIEFVKQGHKVLYSAFGDLKLYDFFYRMSAIVNQHPMQFTSVNLTSEVKLALKKLPQLKDNLHMQFLAPEKFTAGEYVDYIKNSFYKDGKTKLHDWADVIIVDYDANIKSNEKMYLKGEEIYQQLYNLVYPDKLLILLAQTNKFSWGEEVIDMGELGESSRKAQILDMLLTISHPNCFNAQNNVGYLNLCANRRGAMMKTPFFRDVSGQFHEINTDTYAYIKSSSEMKTFIPDIHLFQNGLPGEYGVLDLSLDNAADYSEAYDGKTEILKGEE